MKTLDRYPGVGGYEAAHGEAGLFFGREREARDLMRNILSAKVTILFGPSAVGKSSLVRAGLCHQLKRYSAQVVHQDLRNVVADAERALTAAMAAGDGIAEAQTRAAGEDCDASADQALQDLKRRYADLFPDEYGSGALKSSTSNYRILAFDQFESLYAIDASQPEQIARKFILDLITEHYSLPVGENRILIGVRQDEMHCLDELASRNARILENRFRLRALTLEKAASCITGPPAVTSDVFKFSSPEYTISPKCEIDILEESSFKVLSGNRTNVDLISLQIICRYLEQQVASGEHQKPIVVDTSFYNDNRRVLARTVKRYISNAIMKATPRWRIRRRARNFVFYQLVGAQGERRKRSRDEFIEYVARRWRRTGNIDAAKQTLAGLLDSRVLQSRKDPVLDTVDVEIAHDALAAKVTRVRTPPKRRRAYIGTAVAVSAAVVVGGAAWGFAALQVTQAKKYQSSEITKLKDSHNTRLETIEDEHSDVVERLIRNNEIEADALRAQLQGQELELRREAGHAIENGQYYRAAALAERFFAAGAQDEGPPTSGISYFWKLQAGNGMQRMPCRNPQGPFARSSHYDIVLPIDGNFYVVGNDASAALDIDGSGCELQPADISYDAGSDNGVLYFDPDLRQVKRADVAGSSAAADVAPARISNQRMLRHENRLFVLRQGSLLVSDPVCQAEPPVANCLGELRELLNAETFFARLRNQDPTSIAFDRDRLLVGTDQGKVVEMTFGAGNPVFEEIPASFEAPDDPEDATLSPASGQGCFGDFCNLVHDGAVTRLSSFEPVRLAEAIELGGRQYIVVVNAQGIAQVSEANGVLPAFEGRAFGIRPTAVTYAVNGDTLVLAATDGNQVEVASWRAPSSVIFANNEEPEPEAVAEPADAVISDPRDPRSVLVIDAANDPLLMTGLNHRTGGGVPALVTDMGSRTTDFVELPTGVSREARRYVHRIGYAATVDTVLMGVNTGRLVACPVADIGGANPSCNVVDLDRRRADGRKRDIHDVKARGDTVLASSFSGEVWAFAADRLTEKRIAPVIVAKTNKYAQIVAVNANEVGPSATQVLVVAARRRESTGGCIALFAMKPLLTASNPAVLDCEADSPAVYRFDDVSGKLKVNWVDIGRSTVGIAYNGGIQFHKVKIENRQPVFTDHGAIRGRAADKYWKISFLEPHNGPDLWATVSGRAVLALWSSDEPHPFYTAWVPATRTLRTNNSILDFDARCNSGECEFFFPASKEGIISHRLSADFLADR